MAGEIPQPQKAPPVEAKNQAVEIAVPTKIEAKRIPLQVEPRKPAEKDYEYLAKMDVAARKQAAQMTYFRT